MKEKHKCLVIAAFGLAVIASGCWRYFGQEGGSTGLIFGLTMGPIALIAAAMHAKGMKRSGLILAAVDVALVGGWFCYEALILKGIAVAETRQLIVIGCSAATGIALIWPTGDG